MKTKDFPSVIAAGKTTAKLLESYAERMQTRSPWFSVMKQPPVNGKPSSVYEWKCANGVWLKRADQIKEIGRRCPRCQWRGLLREEK